MDDKVQKVRQLNTIMDLIREGRWEQLRYSMNITFANSLCDIIFKLNLTDIQ